MIRRWFCAFDDHWAEIMVAVGMFSVVLVIIFGILEGYKDSLDNDRTAEARVVGYYRDARTGVCFGVAINHDARVAFSVPCDRIPKGMLGPSRWGGGSEYEQ